MVAWWHGAWCVQIQSIYQALTRSSVHPLGGQAYLHLEQVRAEGEAAQLTAWGQLPPGTRAHAQPHTRARCHTFAQLACAPLCSLPAVGCV